VSTFWLIAAGLIVVIAVALLFVLLPWLRKTQKETLHDPKGVMAILTGSQAPLIVGGIAISLFAVALYFAWIKPDTSATPRMAQNVPMAPEHVEMIKALSARLEQDPNDGKGWAMLARSYAVMGRYNEALPAYEKAANLIQNDPVLLVDYADVLAVLNDKNLQGKPLELIQSALIIDPTNIKGLNLIGTAAFQAGDYTRAVGYWEKLLQLLPPDSPNAKQINTSIANARAQEMGKGEAGKRPQSLPAQGETQPATGGAQISGVVRLSPALAGKVSPTDTVFVFAKAVSGPPMPIAVIRAQVKDLPQKFILNDSMAMMPTMKLSNFQEVVVSAKISKSGNATPQSGDLRGEVAPVKVGANNVQLVIDKVVP
jgi:cytochrome c-type biogenesis protein CcmH